MTRILFVIPQVADTKKLRKKIQIYKFDLYYKVPYEEILIEHNYSLIVLYDDEIISDFLLQHQERTKNVPIILWTRIETEVTVNYANNRNGNCSQIIGVFDRVVEEIETILKNQNHFSNETNMVLNKNIRRPTTKKLFLFGYFKQAQTIEEYFSVIKNKNFSYFFFSSPKKIFYSLLITENSILLTDLKTFRNPEFQYRVLLIKSMKIIIYEEDSNLNTKQEDFFKSKGILMIKDQNFLIETILFMLKNDPKENTRHLLPKRDSKSKNSHTNNKKNKKNTDIKYSNNRLTNYQKSQSLNNGSRSKDRIKERQPNKSHQSVKNNSQGKYSKNYEPRTITRLSTSNVYSYKSKPKYYLFWLSNRIDKNTQNLIINLQSRFSLKIHTSNDLLNSLSIISQTKNTISIISSGTFILDDHLIGHLKKKKCLAPVIAFSQIAKSNSTVAQKLKNMGVVYILKNGDDLFNIIPQLIKHYEKNTKSKSKSN
ncbi:hypothetical protein M0813_03116 [Anaeramoeba flamelloides]|uniref:Ribosomal protein L7Ae/L30e/S12e/Gadd45 domain-containing protein n=1 Tax=Anaeramoeba flamelloides TaxID=1746091 RepID=A0ABQ8Y902_9EUKA|nr:hypothetical protein M0813_03116 [Anaeramoeba flamelloides]